MYTVAFVDNACTQPHVTTLLIASPTHFHQDESKWILARGMGLWFYSIHMHASIIPNQVSFRPAHYSGDAVPVDSKYLNSLDYRDDMKSYTYNPSCYYAHNRHNQLASPICFPA